MVKLLLVSFSLALHQLLLTTAPFFALASSSVPLITLTPHSTGLDSPVAIVDAKDGKNRLYIVERGGKIMKIKRKNGRLYNSPFLNVASKLGPCSGYCAERGLLGLVFHPDYATNGYIYINYTSEDEDTGELRTIVSRFTRSSTSYYKADYNSEVILLSFVQPYSNHNAGDLQFGPDGYLYITSGDGGSGGDPLNKGQALDTMLGKILRIDVDQTSTGKNYTIPPDNPFATSTDVNVLPEIWAYGLRNPWKISFDRDVGDLFIADVGQNEWEEVNYQSSDSTGGENYGWRLMEGNHCFDPVSDCVPEDPTITLTMPMLEYGHADTGGCSVTGGYMYRGKFAKMKGYYLYGDYCTGTIWGAKKLTDGTWETNVVSQNSNLFISSFGEDMFGEHYVAGLMGTIYKISYCWDNKDYVYDNGTEQRTCKWIRKKQKRINRLCQKEEVASNCKQTCQNLEAC